MKHKVEQSPRRVVDAAQTPAPRVTKSMTIKSGVRAGRWKIPKPPLGGNAISEAT